MKNKDGLKSILLLAVAVIGTGGGLVYWQYSARSSAEARVAAIKAKMPDPVKLQNDLAQSVSEMDAYQKQLDHLEMGVPSSAYIPTLLKEIEQCGNANKLTVTGVRPVAQVGLDDKSSADKDYQELEIDISGNGSYRSVMDLVAALQKFPKILAVKTVGLAPRQNLKSTTAELDATVRLKAFVFKDSDKPEDEADKKVALGPSGVKQL